MAPSSRRAADTGPPSGKRAPGRHAGRGTSGGARGVPGPTKKRARAHQGKADLGAGAAPPYTGFIPGESKDLRWATIKDLLYRHPQRPRKTQRLQGPGPAEI